MQNRQIVTFNEHQHRMKLVEIKKAVDQMETTLSKVREVMTDNTKTLQDFEAWLKEQTGFDNAQMAADSKNLQQEYNAVMECIEIEKKNLDAGGYVTKTDAGYKIETELLKDAYTTFLTSDGMKLYNELEEAVKTLKTYPIQALQCINNNWIVDVSRVHTFTQLMKISNR